MTAAFMRLLALLAFVLMPLGMGAVPAAAAAMPKPAATAVDHCGEHPAQPAGKATHGMDCAAACSVVIAEPDRIAERLALPAGSPMLPADASADGLHPEAATPPPRLG